MLDIEIEKIFPPSLITFHEVSHRVTERLAEEKYRQSSGEGDELASYVSGYLDENPEEVANELMLYTWNEMSSDEKKELIGDVGKEVFEDAISSYLDFTKFQEGDYQSQHPILGSEDKLASMYN